MKSSMARMKHLKLCCTSPSLTTLRTTEWKQFQKSKLMKAKRRGPSQLGLGELPVKLADTKTDAKIKIKIS